MSVLTIGNLPQLRPPLGRQLPGVVATYRSFRWTAPGLDFGPFCEHQGILDVDAEVPDGVFDLRVSQQDLDRPQVPGGLVDHRRFRAPKRVRPVLGTTESYRVDPLIHEPSILPCAKVPRVVDAARECVVVDGAAAAFEPGEEARSDVGRKIELNRASGLLLNDDRSSSDISPRYKVADLDLHEIAASQLAVDRQVEKRPITKTALPIQEEANSPDLLLRQRSLCADRFARIPHRAPMRGRIILCVAHCSSPRP
jgi:hypothetical protein